MLNILTLSGVKAWNTNPVDLRITLTKYDNNYRKGAHSASSWCAGGRKDKYCRYVPNSKYRYSEILTSLRGYCRNVQEATLHNHLWSVLSSKSCPTSYPPRSSVDCFAGDLGSTAKEVEQALDLNFNLANRWGCILLLDEADVFLSSRTETDFERNGLVAG